MRIGAFSHLSLLMALTIAPGVFADDTYLSFKSEPGDVVGEGAAGTFDKASGKFDVDVLPGGNGFRFTFTGDTDEWLVELETRDGAKPVPGPYPGATDVRYHSPTKPGLRVTANGRSCEWSEGKFELLEIEGLLGIVTSFAANVEQRCEGSEALLYVELRYGASTSFPPPPDYDGDRVPDSIDNCRFTYNPTQTDDDFGLWGDACDSTVNNTFLSFASDEGDPLGGGESFRLHRLDGRFALKHDDERALVLEFDGDEDWSFYFGAPEGERLEPGLYSGALPGDARGPELLVSRSNGKCENPAGLFEIHELVTSPDGVVDRLAVDYVQSCDGAPPLRGSVRYDASHQIMIRPKPGSSLTDSVVTFEWSDHVSARRNYILYVGTRKDASDILRTGPLGQQTSLQVSGLPIDGSPVWVRLWVRTVKGWTAADFQYTAVSYSFIPEITSPVPGSTLPGAAVRFEWTANGLGVTDWMLLLGSSQGQSNFYKGPLGPETYADVTGLPTDGSPVYAKLWFVADGVWDFEEFVYNADDSGGTAGLVSPLESEALPGSEVTFAWEPNGSIVTQWVLQVGTYPGASNLYKSDALPAGTTSTTVTGLPTDGSVIHVRLWYVTGRWNSKDYAFTTSDAGGTPEIVSPAASAPLAGSDVTFEWLPNGSVVSQWQLVIGSYKGGSDLHNSGTLSSTTRSHLVSGLPTDGSDVYVRLWYVNGKWNAKDYVFQAASTGGKPAMVSPAPGGVLPGSDVDFQWASNGSTVSSWWLNVGSYPGDSSLFSSGAIAAEARSYRVTGLPTDGSKVYVRLWYVSGQWYSLDYEYTADASGGIPQFVAPAAGTVLPSADVTFSWAPNGSRVTGWKLELGTQRGIYDLFQSDVLAGDVTSLQVTGLPSDGTPIYARLWYIAGPWSAIEAQFTASSAGGPPFIVSPAAGSVLPGDTVELAWSEGGSMVKAWWLNVGSSPGTNDIFSSGELTADERSLVVGGLPLDGRQIWVQLWYQTNDGTWARIDTAYVAAGGAASEDD